MILDDSGGNFSEGEEGIHKRRKNFHFPSPFWNLCCYVSHTKINRVVPMPPPPLFALAKDMWGERRSRHHTPSDTAFPVSLKSEGKGGEE